MTDFDAPPPWQQPQQGWQPADNQAAALLPADLDEVGVEIARLLPDTKGQIGAVASCLAAGVTDRKTLVAAEAAANVGAVANILSNIEAIRDQKIPKAPSRAEQARSAARSFLKQHKHRLSPAAKERLEDSIEKLTGVVESADAQIEEEAALTAKGDELEEKLLKAGGVYAYTYPQYWRYPTVEGTRRTLLKVGMTTKDAPQRVREQARGTNVPEEPLLLRSYRSATLEPKEAEKRFHRLLRAADHESPHKAAGSKEWFETSVEFLDAIAEEFGMEIDAAESGEDA